MTTKMPANDDERKMMATKRDAKVLGRIRWEVDFGKDSLTGGTNFLWKSAEPGILLV